MPEHKYVIIGGGMTASAAIEGIRSVDANGSIVVFTAEKERPYDRPPLTKGLWKGDATVDEIVHELPEGVDFYPGRRVKSHPA